MFELNQQLRVFCQYICAGCSLLVVGCAPINRPEKVSLVNEQLKSYASQQHLEISSTTINDKLTSNGRLKSTQSRIGHLKVNGNTELDNTTVNNQAHINGNAMLNRSVVKKDLTISGNLQLKHSHIEGNIKSAGRYVLLHDSDIVNLELSGPGPVTVKILNNSTIRGSVRFQSGGEVVLSPSSKILGRVYHNKHASKDLKINMGSK